MAKQVTGYSRIQIALHWVIALLIIVQITSKNSIKDVNALINKGQEVDVMPLLANFHIYSGMLILLLALWRIYLRVTRGAPPPPENAVLLEKISKLVNLLIYIGIIMMPITGMGIWYGGDDYTPVFHAWYKFAFIGAVLLHIATSVYHQWVLKNGLIKRMMKSG